MKIIFNKKYADAISKMSRDMEVSEGKVVELAVAHYQMVHKRIMDGETVTWSGDAQRLAEFRGPLD
jgi:hypothetical protein